MRKVKQYDRHLTTRATRPASRAPSAAAVRATYRAAAAVRAACANAGSRVVPGAASVTAAT
jgi:hypothetical protein